MYTMEVGFLWFEIRFVNLQLQKASKFMDKVRMPDHPARPKVECAGPAQSEMKFPWIVYLMANV